MFLKNSKRFFKENTFCTHFLGERFSSFGSADLGANNSPVWARSDNKDALITVRTIGAIMLTEVDITRVPKISRASEKGSTGALLKTVEVTDKSSEKMPFAFIIK